MTCTISRSLPYMHFLILLFDLDINTFSSPLRNKCKHACSDEISAACEAMEGLKVVNGLECKITCNSSKEKGWEIEVDIIRIQKTICFAQKAEEEVCIEVVRAVTTSQGFQWHDAGVERSSGNERTECAQGMKEPTVPKKKKKKKEKEKKLVTYHDHVVEQYSSLLSYPVQHL
uniref:Uncharacterized protein n=1 Tax=Cucumis melo TaxID=3656 RepID=A0A9I9EHE0_CUCME